MSKTPCFLVVSNLRSGSTWLTLMLGELDGVSVDYEFKWKPCYEPQPIHYVIPDEKFSCLEALRSIDPDSLICGSKLTFDDYPISCKEYGAIRKTIDPEIRIIHLVRDYGEVLNSIARGVQHELRDPDSVPNNVCYEEIKNIAWIRDNWNTLSDAEKMKRLHIGAVIKSLYGLVHTDLFAASLARKNPYIRIHYKDVAKDFHRLGSFVGAGISRTTAKKISEKSPTVKLPKENVIRNWRTIKFLSSIANIIRDLSMRLVNTMPKA